MQQGKKLATPYSRAVMEMLPIHRFFPDKTEEDWENEREEREESLDHFERPSLVDGDEDIFVDGDEDFIVDEDFLVEGDDDEEESLDQLEPSLDDDDNQEVDFSELDSIISMQQRAIPFEPINEIHVHGLTMQQLFVPTSESRHFTREDAAKAFNERMLSPDDRIPHKELVKFHRRIKDGEDEFVSRQQFVAGARAAERADVLRDASKKDRLKRVTVAVPTERAEFRFKKVTVDDGGADGRSRLGTGWKYGAPYEDRKKDQVKHPTRYE